MKCNTKKQMIKVYFPTELQPYYIKTDLIFEVGMVLDYNIITKKRKKTRFRNKMVDAASRVEYQVVKIKYEVWEDRVKRVFVFKPEIYLELIGEIIGNVVDD